MSNCVEMMDVLSLLTTSSVEAEEKGLIHLKIHAVNEIYWEQNIQLVRGAILTVTKAYVYER